VSALGRDVVHVGFVTGDGGDAIQIMELCSGLIRRGVRARVLVPKLETTRVFVERCRAESVPAEQSDAVRADILGAQQDVGRLIQLFWKYRDAILHLHTGDVCLPRRVQFALKVVRPRHVVVTIQSPFDYLLEDRVRANVWSRAVQSSIRIVICPSQHCHKAQLACGIPPDRARIIHNCVDLDKFAAGNARSALHTLNLPDGTPLLVFSARMDRQKRPIDALRAFLCVQSEFPLLHAVFVGAGPDTAAVEEMARSSDAGSRIHFAGFQRNIPDWLAAASVWILPTESENFSLAVLEALAAGRAIVSTRCPGNDEVLVNGRNAIVTEVGDVAGLSCAIRRLLIDDTLRDRLRADARTTAEQYSLDKMTDKVIRCYESILAGPSG
jgi:glycosyltransferase involved in cell wall biosynthesis